MSRSRIPLWFGLGVLGMAVGANGQPNTAGGGFTELQRSEVAGASDLEVVMGVITRHGESIGSKHYHPGGEFGFILEGAVSVTTESEPARTLEAGDSFHLPPGVWHAVSTPTQGARTVVFRVVEKGQPMIVGVD